jgi:hypothetical protein
MTDAIETLDVALNSPAKQPSVHRLVLADGHVGKVSNGVKFVILEKQRLRKKSYWQIKGFLSSYIFWHIQWFFQYFSSKMSW